MEPTVKAVTVEDVAARKLPNVIAVFEIGLAKHAAVVIGRSSIFVCVEELIVESELIGEHDESGESRSNGG
jgi:hypothetical protein